MKARYTFLHGDCLTVLRNIKSCSIPLIVTSPPYNLRNDKNNRTKYGFSKSKWNPTLLEVGYDNYTDDMPYKDYISWQKECLSEMYRIITNDGAIFYNTKNRIQKGIEINKEELFEKLPVRTRLIWNKASGMNFNYTYPLPIHEYIYLIAKPKFKLKRYNNQFIKSVINIPPERQVKHPAPFPVALPKLLIGSTNAKIVLDPFMGSGSTAIATKELNRKFIGIDLSQKYIDLSRDRYKKAKNF